MLTLLTATQVAERLQRSASAIRSMCDSGELACYRIGKKREYRIAESALDDYLREKSYSPPDKPEPRRRRQFGPTLDFLRSLGYDG